MTRDKIVEQLKERQAALAGLLLKNTQLLQSIDSVSAECAALRKQLAALPEPVVA